MNKLPKEKRAQVLWLIAGIGMVMSLLLLWFAWNSYSNLKSKIGNWKSEIGIENRDSYFESLPLFHQPVHCLLAALERWQIAL